MIQSFALEFDDRAAMERVAKKLREKYGVTGEIEMSPIEDGGWRLTVHSEKQLREATLESLEGRRVKAKTIISKT